MENDNNRADSSRQRVDGAEKQIRRQGVESDVNLDEVADRLLLRQRSSDRDAGFDRGESALSTASVGSAHLPDLIPVPSALDHRLPNRCSLVVIYIASFLNSLAYGIVTPTIAAHVESMGQDPEIAGYLLAVTAWTCLGISFPVLWYIRRWGTKTTILCQAYIAVIASAIYALSNSITALWISRFLLGLAVVSSPHTLFISQTVGLEHRGQVMKCMFFSITLGTMCGPLLAFVIGSCCDGSKCDPHRAPGSVMVFLYIVYTYIVTLIFQDPDYNPHSDPEAELNTGNRSGMSFVPVLALFVVGVASLTATGSWEVFTPMLAQSWNWSETYTSLYMAGVMSAVFVFPFLSLDWDDRDTIYCCVLVSLVSSSLLVDMKSQLLTQVVYTVASMVLLTACQMTYGMVMSLLTKVVPKSRKQAVCTLMVWSQQAGYLVGPTIGSHFGQNTYAAVLVCIMTLALSCAHISYSQLTPHSKAS